LYVDFSYALFSLPCLIINGNDTEEDVPFHMNGPIYVISFEV